MRSLRRSLALLALLATATIASSGCPSAPLLVNARPLGNGKNAVIVAGSVYGLSLASTGSTDKDSVSGLLTAPSIDLMYRHGFGNHFDMGLALTGWGKVAVDGKINLLNSPGFAFSIDPGIGGFFLGAGDVGGGYLQFTVPFLFDIAFSPSTRLTLAPMYSGIFSFAAGGSNGSSASAFSHLVGGDIGFEFILGRMFRLQPFVGAMWYYNANLSESNVSVSSVWWNAGLAAKFIF